MESALTQLIAGLPGVVLPFAGPTAPSGWLLCHGQSITRSGYPRLFAAIGTTYGSVDGSHFNLPDLRGRVAAGKDDMGGSGAGLLSISMTGNTTNGSTAIAALSSTADLAVGMKVVGTGIPDGATIATIASGTSITISSAATATGTGVDLRFGIVDGVTLGSKAGSQAHKLVTEQMPAHTHQVTNASSNTVGGAYTTAMLNEANGTQPSTTSVGGGQAHSNMQPTIILNYIIKT